MDDTPLERPVLSWRDADLNDLEFVYLDGYFTNKSETNLSITGSSGGAAVALSDLAPAAGGNLGDLSPSAGGGQGQPGTPPANEATRCANAYLDSEFDIPAEQRTCQTRPLNTAQ